VVLVFEIVAVEQIASAEAAPMHDDINLLVSVDADGIFPSALVDKGWSAVTTKYLKGY
jgi:hypothetical protein